MMTRDEKLAIKLAHIRAAGYVQIISGKYTGTVCPIVRHVGAKWFALQFLHGVLVFHHSQLEPYNMPTREQF